MADDNVGDVQMPAGSGDPAQPPAAANAAAVVEQLLLEEMNLAAADLLLGDLIGPGAGDGPDAAPSAEDVLAAVAADGAAALLGGDDPDALVLSAPTGDGDAARRSSHRSRKRPARDDDDDAALDNEAAAAKHAKGNAATAADEGNGDGDDGEDPVWCLCQKPDNEGRCGARMRRVAAAGGQWRKGLATDSPRAGHCTHTAK